MTDRPNRADLEAALEIVHAVMLPTAQHHWPLLSARAGAEVWVKHENHAPCGAFKVRGGLVYTADLARADPAVAGVVCATRGNHGQSVAFAARRAGLSARIVVPHGNSVEKNAAMRALGAELIVHGEDFQDALDHAETLAGEDGLHLFPSWHPLLVAGVGTYGWELFSALPDLDAVYVPIGLGSGIGGVIAARDSLGARAEVIGVVAAGAPAYARSFAEGRAVATNRVQTMADGLAVRVPSPEALETILAGAARVVAVDDAAIRAAMRHFFTDTHNVVEGAGAAPLAALLAERDRMAGRKVALVASGGNVDRTVYQAVLGGGNEDENGSGRESG